MSGVMKRGEAMLIDAILRKAADEGVFDQTPHSRKRRLMEPIEPGYETRQQRRARERREAKER